MFPPPFLSACVRVRPISSPVWLKPCGFGVSRGVGGRQGGVVFPIGSGSFPIGVFCVFCMYSEWYSGVFLEYMEYRPPENTQQNTTRIQPYTLPEYRFKKMCILTVFQCILRDNTMYSECILHSMQRILTMFRNTRILMYSIMVFCVYSE